MDLRRLNIGTRLAAGFGLILLAASAMLAATLASLSSQRDSLLRQMQAAEARGADAQAMQLALLSSAVAVRNMGLQTTVEAVQKDEAEAKRQRADYLAARRRLEAAGLDDEARAPLVELAEIDRQMELHFKSAVDLAATFNPEQAAQVITQKIDPLLNQAATRLAGFITLQKQQAARAAEAAGADARRVERLALVAGVAVILGSGLLAWRLTLSITRPLQEAAQAATRVADGDLDFTIHPQGDDEATRLLRAVEAMRASLAGVVARVRENSESVATASSQIAHGNSDLSARTEQQASALQQTSASMEQLGTAVRHNAEHAERANRLAQGAAGIATQGGQAVSEVVQTMQGIEESSRRIADIIGVIDGIAFQTNILALNAAVEAARAGEQGRGFAVVASEVRSLAQRSAAAAREIKGLIATSTQRVEQGSAQVVRAGATMAEVVQAVQRVTEIMGEISRASGEQSAGVAQVGQAVTQMDHATQQNAALVEESAAAAESLKQQAQALVQAVAVFRLQSRGA
jgi:methyl-accepting chemotaxis protein